jgi:uncharacterized membrane protein YfcA
MEPSFAITGFIVGFVVGMTGVGGGSLMTPILVLLFSVKPAVAVGTDLLYAAITKSSGVFVHHNRGNVEWRVVALLATGSVPSALLAVSVLGRFEAAGVDYDHVITVALSIALILTSLVLLFKGPIQQLGGNERLAAVRAVRRRLRGPLTVAAGALIGVLVTLSSVGAGALGAAFLFFLYPRMRPISIVGTDIAHAVPITAIAGLGHAHLGTVDFLMLGNLLVGSLPGIWLGGHTGARLPDGFVRPALASMLLLIGVRLAL